MPAERPRRGHLTASFRFPRDYIADDKGNGINVVRRCPKQTGDAWRGHVSRGGQVVSSSGCEGQARDDVCIALILNDKLDREWLA